MKHTKKRDCFRCAHLPEGNVVLGHDHRNVNDYNVFVRNGLQAGFSDDQINFLADWLEISDGTESHP